MTDFASPLQRAAMAAGRPPIGLPQQQQQQPSGLDARIQQREQQLDSLSPQIDALLEQQAKGYEGAQQNESALKDLLLQTQQRLGNLQYAPSPQEQLGRAAAAATSGATYKGGLGSEMGRAAGAMADTSAEARQGAIAREQLMAKYGIDAQQADLMAKQFGIQAAQARLTPYMHRADTINSQLDRMTMTAPRYDPATQGMLAFAKALATSRGQIAGAEGAGGNDQFDPKNPDPTTDALANYEAQLGPRPTTGRNPAQLKYAQQQWDQQFEKIKGVNPDYRQGQYAIANAVRKNFDVGPLGNKVQFTNNVFGHLDTYKQILQAVNAGDWQTGNKLAQRFGVEIGHPEVTSAQAVQTILGPELVKAIVPNAGTGGERIEEVAQLAASQSPQQWAGRHAAYKQVLGTQIGDARRQFYSSLLLDPDDKKTSPFRDRIDREWNIKLAPEARGVLAEHDHPRPAGVDPGWQLHQDTKSGAFAYVSPDGKQFKEVP